MSEPEPTPLPPRRPPTFGPANVAFSVVLCYCLIGVFASKNIYHWSTRLPVSKPATAVREAADWYARRLAALGLDLPEQALESGFLAIQAARPLRMPGASVAGAPKKGLRSPDPASPPRATTPHPLRLAAAESEAALPPTAKGRGPNVLVIGDSIMMAVGPVIKRDVTLKLGGDAVVNARLSTGLARPDVYDWVKELHRAAAEQRYDYVVMMLGTNDSQDFVDGGQILTYGSPPWIKVYKQRLSALMDVACKGSDHGVWIGLPPMRSAVFNRKASRINGWAQQLVELHPCMAYVPLDKVIGDGRGRYASYLKIDDRLQKVRVVDGIHVTARGGALISQTVLGLLQDGSEPAH